MNPIVSKSEGPRVSIVSPAYNEAQSLPMLIDKIDEVIDDDFDYEIIIVNDGSGDETPEILYDLAKENPQLRFISFSRNFGHQAAIKAGISHARGSCVIVLDADMQQPPSLIPEMILKWQAGFKIVMTKRNDVKQKSYFKKLSSRLYYSVLNFLGDTHLESGAADFYLMDRQVVETLKSFGECRWFLRGILPTLGFKRCIIDFNPDQRQFGHTRYTLPKMVRLAIDGILTTSIKPLRFSIFLSAVVAAFAAIYAVYALYISLVLGVALPGWTSVMLAVNIIGAMQLLMFGIIGEYLGRTLLEVRKRPDFIIADTNISTAQTLVHPTDKTIDEGR